MRDAWRLLMARGWSYTKDRDEVRCACPRPECGVVLTAAQKGPQGDEIASVSDLSAVIAARRVALGVTSEVLDQCAGFAQGHTSKIEVSGTRLANTNARSGYDMAALMLRMAEAGLTDDVRATLAAMGAKAIKATAKPRVPQVDTVMLALQAMGGSLFVRWGTPPAIMRAAMKRDK